MKTINTISLVLIIIGGVNWGLVGAANFDLVATLFGSGSIMARVVYILVGVSAIVQLVRLFSPDTSRTTTANA